MNDQGSSTPPNQDVEGNESELGSASELAGEALLERPGEALAAQGEHALRRTIRLREESAELRASTSETNALLRRPRPARPRGGTSREFVHILREDPELGLAVPPEQRLDLTRALRAPVIELRDVRWEPPVFDSGRTYGLLLLDGLLGRRLRMARAVSTELLCNGDILRPWQDPPEETLDAHVEWLVLSPARLAVLDETVTAKISQSPELVVAFASRLVRRWYLAAHLTAIAHLPRVEERLLAILWRLADDWGRVTPEGVRIPLRLRHQLLGELIGARRSSVTLGLRTLRERGDVIETGDGTFLLRSPPVAPPGEQAPAEAPSRSPDSG